MIGHLLGGRYDIIERIGGGGMALVYRAQDILLNRNVAVKVLRQQFVHDEEFIRRFRREAQSAASLSHQNVVSIYDVGQEEDIHYIVMECVEGKNLNEIIKERAPLQVEEAVRIASQICDALEHAHHNQIIHRDIKPHNILIGRNGRVKVTDFGIARAVTSTTITQTGSVVGSVHYFSPEHAKGVTTGEKSDLYSLGIVLYQMLTAQLPFLGESPISVALKHLQEEFEEPRKVNPLIPQSVENIILKSMRKNPQERYQSAEEMMQDLETCLLPERRNEHKILFDDEEDEAQTRIIPAIKPLPSSGISKASADWQSAPEMTEEVPQRPVRKSNKKVYIWAGSVVALLVAMALLVMYVTNLMEVPEVKVPNVVNMTEEQARAELVKAGLTVKEPVLEQYKEGIDPGVVFIQDQPEGTVLKKGALIELTIGAEKPLQKMPDLLSKQTTYEDAVAKLVAVGIPEERITRADDQFSDKQAGTIIEQTPAANTDYNPDEVQVTLIVSKGPDTIKMPDLINKTQAEAEKMISDAGLKLEAVSEESSFTAEQGKVIKQWPAAAGEDVDPGSKVTLTVSTGLPPEAITYSYELPVAPAEEGKNSDIRVTYTDARVSDKEWGKRTINTTQMLTIDLLLAPNKDGVVSVYRDGQFFDTYVIPYIDAKNGTVQQPQVTPPASSEPDPPAGDESDGSTSEGEGSSGEADPAAEQQDSTDQTTEEQNQSGEEGQNNNNN
ncbi:Stk1 family PASTA domain-containing Ser/Thr kinase [Paenibacillus sp. P96]|uniref:non-specific serine/threonine protein kinase n=1 Tax=Paenibacillus zeirhizosphaerae TaxID=2987519 RepID=A0ABT9FQ14_9BACL|nr:Stk1 family PASTA domain-containing Ser/Thr kinase [Paenibacillus sp. P96]MDP4096816.1 Stk1 family PASTA domain-containing Ser/Thr kinase [Paenibacillus sp. P96]